jgi:glutaminyl-tRNA synthetase
MALLNPNALEIVKAYVEPGMKDVTPDTRLQFERHGYFVADRVDSVVGKPVFNRVTTLKDSGGSDIGHTRCDPENKKMQSILLLKQL